MRITVLLLALVGCAGPTPDDSGTDSDTDAGTDTASLATGRLSGQVTDAEGNALQDAQVNMCRTVCTTVRSDAQGAYAFGPLEVGTYSFHVVPPDDTHAQPLVPLSLSEDDDRTVDVAVPALSQSATLPSDAPAEVEIAPGVFVTAQQGDLTLTFEDPPSEVAGAAVVESDWLPVSFEGEVLAMWYLAPYEASAEDAGGLPIRLANDHGLSEGETVELWRSSYWDYDFVKVGDFTAGSDGLTDDDARLTELTTLVLVRPAG